MKRTKASNRQMCELAAARRTSSRAVMSRCGALRRPSVLSQGQGRRLRFTGRQWKSQSAKPLAGLRGAPQRPDRAGRLNFVNWRSRPRQCRLQCEDIDDVLLAWRRVAQTAPRKKRTMSADARRRISEAQKARWVRQKGEGAQTEAAPAPTKTRKGSRKISRDAPKTINTRSRTLSRPTRLP